MKNKSENDDRALEEFSIIFDKAKNEKIAMSNAVDYYLILKEDFDLEIDINSIIELAEYHGYDLSDMEEKIKNAI